MTAELRPVAALIVGVPRSGTTLLRLMIDRHPLVAIPPETGFVAGLADRCMSQPDWYPTPHEFVDHVSNFPPDAPAWRDFSMTTDDLLNDCLALDSFSVSQGLRCFYGRYANGQGKHMWGDKTPTYGPHVASIQRLLPEVRVVHIIRDGRDVAASLRQQWFAPSDQCDQLGTFWRDQILSTRQAATDVDHYLEIRYESLILDTEQQLRLVCAHLDIPFDSAMLSYFQAAPTRLTEHHARYRKDGALVVSRQRRLVQQQWVTQPPSPERIGSWKTQLSDHDLAQFLSTAGPLLDDLGYQ